MRRLNALAIAALITLSALSALSAAACKGISDPGSNTNTDFVDKPLLPGAGNVHLFGAGRAGEFTFSLIAMAPDAGTQVRVNLGQDVGGNCTPYAPDYIMSLGSTSPTSPIQKGSYCVIVADPGLKTGTPVLTQTETYTLRVSHP